MKDIRASTLIQQLTRIIGVFGLPDVLMTDNGSPFTSFDFSSWCNNNSIRLVHSPAWHPPSNGAAERMVQESKKFLKRLELDYPDLSLQDLLERVQQTLRMV